MYIVRILITPQMEVNLIFAIILWDFVHFGFWIYKFQSVFFRSLKILSRLLGLLFGAWYKMEHYSGACGRAWWLTLRLLGPTREKGRGQGTHFKNTLWWPNFLSLGPTPLKFLHLPKSSQAGNQIFSESCLWELGATNSNSNQVDSDQRSWNSRVHAFNSFPCCHPDETESI